MTSNDKDRIAVVFRRYVTDEAEMEAVLRGDGIMDAVSIDSLTMLQLVTDLENEFGTRFDIDALERTFATIDSLAAHLGGS